MHRTFVMSVAALGVIALAQMGRAQEIEPSGELPRRLATGGAWTSATFGPWRAGGAQNETQTHRTRTWSLQVTRDDDDSFSGDLVVTGAPEFSAGVVRGRMAWPGVRGTVSDKSGNEIGTFEGRRTENGFEGRFVMQSGEVRSWSWDVPR